VTISATTLCHNDHNRLVEQNQIQAKHSGPNMYNYDPMEEGSLPENNSILTVFSWFKYNTYLKQRH